MLELKSTEDLMKIVAAGGGIKIGTKQRSTEDLMRIAGATGHKGSRVIFAGMSHRSTDDSMRIGAAGKGHILFED